MPRITCPNCGMTINLENRREIDFDLIATAAKKRPRTFTELLHITKLSRKTLSSRLKELCKNRTLIKSSGFYELNNASKFEIKEKFSARRFSKIFNNRKMKIGLTLVVFLLSSSVSGYVLAMFIAYPQHEEYPKPIGDFTMALDVNNVEDLYTWQVIITFNSSELNVLKTMPGGFIEVEYPFFFNATDVADGILLLGSTLAGNVSGKNGTGTLAIINFEYFVEESKTPQLALSEKAFKTYLLNSKGSIIPFDGLTTLTLTIESP